MEDHAPLSTSPNWAPASAGVAFFIDHATGNHRAPKLTPN